MQAKLKFTKHWFSLQYDGITFNTELISDVHAYVCIVD